MNPAKIVIHEIERQRVLVILQLLGKSIRQSREPSHQHAHREVLPLNVAGRNVLVVGTAR